MRYDHTTFHFTCISNLSPGNIGAYYIPIEIMGQGRPPTPLDEKIKQGIVRASHQNFNALCHPEMIEKPEPPDTWPEDAKEHYIILRDDLFSKGLLFQTDLDLLESYSFACYKNRKAQKWIADYLESYEDEDKKTDHEDRQFWLRLERESLDNMRRLGTEFGFTPASKSKIAVPVKSMEDKGNDIQEKLKDLMKIA